MTVPGHTVLRVCYATSGTGIGTVLRVCYAVSGTDIGHCTTRLGDWFRVMHLAGQGAGTNPNAPTPSRVLMKMYLRDLQD
eukprot:1197926-Rhodomonas_salina.4